MHLLSPGRPTAPPSPQRAPRGLKKQLFGVSRWSCKPGMAPTLLTLEPDYGSTHVAV